MRGSNGVPDALEVFAGRSAIFIADDVSAGTASDRSVLAGSDDRWSAGTVPAESDLSNAYVFTTSDSQGNLVLYAGVERLSPVEGVVQLEFNQGVFYLGEEVDGASGRIVGERTPGDILVRLSFDGDGALGSVELQRWATASPDEPLGYALVETLSGEGCNLASAP